ncbi:lysosomal thioesterase PPT2-like isoform X3 [Xyrichtys novacula]|uniref:palmitoyl-CoA hydrolase n=1 Tax=Xyrichtys novacula TaxID=13765 RepID=A0AAV1FP14_XYRNO|nr:lysosomal thioesterase PPT2-like isoform X3 [Xyrichtys novacula]
MQTKAQQMTTLSTTLARKHRCCGGREMKSLQTIRAVSLLLLLLLLLMGAHIDGYKPVILVHGLFDRPQNYEILTEFIKQAHPDTEVHVISVYNGTTMRSLRPLWRQVRGFEEKIKPIMEKSPDGVHLLCFSQGALICRAILYKTAHHNVDTFISLASPQAGQYGVTDILNRIIPHIEKNKVFPFCYNIIGQGFSICNYWNDPHQGPRYRNNNYFLARINGDRPDPKMKVWKENFLRIKKLVLIGGPDDGAITPWQSSLFGFYDEEENVVEMKDQNFYKEDLFGLKTLDDRGDISTCVHSGVYHTRWTYNRTVFNDCIEKWLT